MKDARKGVWEGDAGEGLQYHMRGSVGQTRGRNLAGKVIKRAKDWRRTASRRTRERIGRTRKIVDEGRSGCWNDARALASVLCNTQRHI